MIPIENTQNGSTADKHSLEISHALQAIRPSYIREILSDAKSPGVISLAGGLPSTELLPVDLFAQAIETLAENTELFQYGETQGYAPLVNYIQQDPSLIPCEHIPMVCNGSQQGLDLIARAFLNPGDTIVMEAPSYLGALQVFGLSRTSITAVPQTPQGPDLNQLETAFQAKKVKLFYAVPDFHNPTGICWSLETRQHVAALCQQYGVILVEDIPYRDLRFSGEALPLASSFCPEQAITLRSFSKTAAPGIRLGVVAAPEKYLQPMITIKQACDLHTALPMQAALLHVLNNSDYPKHLLNIRQAYQQRYQHFVTALETLAELGCSFEEVQGGMFIWLRLPKMDSMDLAKTLLGHQVAVVPSDVFYHNDEQVAPALRLNFTYCDSEVLHRAVLTIKTVLESKL